MALAPAERDVYSMRRQQKNLRSLGAKPDRRLTAKNLNILRSYKYFAPTARGQRTMLSWE